MVSWSGPRTGPCSTCLPVPIRTPEPYRRGSVSLLAVFPAWTGSLALSTGCFFFGVGFVLKKVYPQTRRAYYLFSYYYLFFNYMSGDLFHPRKFRPEVFLFHA